jgi:hypothetical protein
MRALVIASVLLFAGTASADFVYPLDALSRQVVGSARCPDVALETYGGSTIRYVKPTRIYVGFEEPLRGFEEIVRQAAVEVYGRPPRRLRHLGTYACRAIRGIRALLSEHALGNAIDVEGFDFGPAPRGGKAPPGLRGAFTVRIEKHWNGHRGVAALHARFLRLVAERTIARPDLFRVVLGPSYPGHHNHFHLDVAPYRLVDVFGDSR